MKKINEPEPLWKKLAEKFAGRKIMISNNEYPSRTVPAVPVILCGYINDLCSCELCKNLLITTCNFPYSVSNLKVFNNDPAWCSNCIYTYTVGSALVGTVNISRVLFDKCDIDILLSKNNPDYFSEMINLIKTRKLENDWFKKY